jgi:hypothetical protein
MAFEVEAHWEQRVWWAAHRETNGLMVEAATIETLRQAVERSFPELAGLTLKLGPEEEAVLAQLATEGEGRGAETARHLRV